MRRNMPNFEMVGCAWAHITHTVCMPMTPLVCKLAIRWRWVVNFMLQLL